MADRSTLVNLIRGGSNPWGNGPIAGRTTKGAAAKPAAKAKAAAPAKGKAKSKGGTKAGNSAAPANVPIPTSRDEGLVMPPELAGQDQLAGVPPELMGGKIPQNAVSIGGDPAAAARAALAGQMVGKVPQMALGGGAPPELVGPSNDAAVIQRMLSGMDRQQPLAATERVVGQSPGEDFQVPFRVPSALRIPSPELWNNSGPAPKGGRLQSPLDRVFSTRFPQAGS